MITIVTFGMYRMLVLGLDDWVWGYYYRQSIRIGCSFTSQSMMIGQEYIFIAIFDTTCTRLSSNYHNIFIYCLFTIDFSSYQINMARMLKPRNDMREINVKTSFNLSLWIHHTGYRNSTEHDAWYNTVVLLMDDGDLVIGHDGDGKVYYDS